jgi:preprotein translocase subunit SecB
MQRNMDKKNKMESGFRINQLLLLESNFKRLNKVQFEGDIPELKIDINTEVGVQGKVISVEETVTITQKYNDIEQFSFSVKMAGLFECIGDSSLTDYEDFGSVNGAAIIFPYIREHITNLSLKAGLNPIVLPPVNFTGNRRK